MFRPLNNNLTKAVPSRAAKSSWMPQIDLPVDALPPPTEHPTLGLPSAVHTYRTPTARICGFVWRFNLPEGKEFRPVTYCINEMSGAKGWRFTSWVPPRPLYNLHLLHAHQDADVLVVEGEKAADAATRLFPEMVVTTSPGGAKAARQADWRPLRGRRVFIWGDHDDAGRKYVSTVVDLLERLHA